MLYNLLGLGALLGTVSFSCYVTFAPGMKGMVFRPDQEGEIHFVPSNIVRLAVASFHNKDLWRPNAWDMNWIMHMLGGCCLLHIPFN
jgi:hypothetical protein